MADFYVKYGSKNAKLIANYHCGNVNLKLHKLGIEGPYVISNNRKILKKCLVLDVALGTFHNAIYLESPDTLFNN